MKLWMNEQFFWLWALYKLELGVEISNSKVTAATWVISTGLDEILYKWAHWNPFTGPMVDFVME